MAYLALGIASLLALFLLGRAFVNADPAALARGVRWAAVVLAILLLVFLIASEQLGPALAVIGGLLTVALRGRALWQHFRAASGPPPGQTSEVETDTLRMTLDHDSGTMRGTIRRGPHQGRRLNELSREELVALWRQCRVEDEASAKLLETYLDRTAPDWRGGREGGRSDDGGAAGRRSGSGRPTAAMTREEAYEILGLAQGAATDEIKAAHRRLMLKLHPDQGGSTYLAARINQAKDLLTKG
jgi:DnaJ domain